MNNSTRSGFIPYQMGRYDRLDMLLSRGLRSILDKELNYNMKAEISNICSSISTAMVEVVKKYRKSLFPIPVGDHTHIVCLPDEFVVGSVVVRRKTFIPEGFLTNRSPQEVVFRIICAVLLSNNHYISEPLCKKISELVWNIAKEFVESDARSNPRRKKSYVPSNRGATIKNKTLPSSALSMKETIVLMDRMTEQGASKEEIGRVEKYLLASVAIEQALLHRVEVSTSIKMVDILNKYGEENK